jgi:hypothetical protein
VLLRKPLHSSPQGFLVQGSFVQKYLARELFLKEFVVKDLLVRCSWFQEFSISKRQFLVL